MSDDDESVVVAAGDTMLGRDPREIADVFGQDGVAARHRRREDLCVGAASQSERRDRERFDSNRAESVGQRRWIHLVNQQLHRASAAAVSLR